MNEYFLGKKLYGDDFQIDQITEWYEQETEAYADLGSNDQENYEYHYDALNNVHGFNKLEDRSFVNVLGFGSAWGHEFKPLIDRIENLTIIEPSDNLRSNKIGDINPEYVKPEINGTLQFSNNHFDLITCFGTLHHIPNVSYVLSELIRVLKPNGYLLIREPIVSMGNWEHKRAGLTMNERGIPVSFFEEVFRQEGVQIVSKEYCFTAISLIQRTIGKFFRKPLLSYKYYVMFDMALSSILKKNVHYHATKIVEKVAPSCIFYIIKKTVK